MNSFLKIVFYNDNHVCCKLYCILVYVFMIYKENVYGFIKICKQEQSKDTCIWFMYTFGQSNKLHVLLLKHGQYRIWMRVLQILDRLGVNYITANPAGSDKLLTLYILAMKFRPLKWNTLWPSKFNSKLCFSSWLVTYHYMYLFLLGYTNPKPKVFNEIWSGIALESVKLKKGLGSRIIHSL